MLAATKQAQARMQEYLKVQKPSPCTLEQGLLLALRAWAIGSGSLVIPSQRADFDDGQLPDSPSFYAAAEAKRPAAVPVCTPPLAPTKLAVALAGRLLNQSSSRAA